MKSELIGDYPVSFSFALFYDFSGVVIVHHIIYDYDLIVVIPCIIFYRCDTVIEYFMIFGYPDYRCWNNYADFHVFFFIFLYYLFCYQLETVLFWINSRMYYFG